MSFSMRNRVKERIGQTFFSLSTLDELFTVFFGKKITEGKCIFSWQGDIAFIPRHNLRMEQKDEVLVRPLKFKSYFWFLQLILILIFLISFIWGIW